MSNETGKPNDGIRKGGTNVYEIRPFAVPASQNRHDTANDASVKPDTASDEHDTEAEFDEDEPIRTPRPKQSSPRTLANASSSAKKKSQGVSTKLLASAVIVIALVLLGCIFVLMYLITDVDTIVVVGNDPQTHSSESIINSSGLYTGKNLFSYDLSAAARRIESDPYVEVLSVKREFPSTIRITVRERTEYAAIVGANSTFCIVDINGFVLYIGPRSSVDGLISVFGISTNGFCVGTSINADKSKLRTYTLMEIIGATAFRRDDMLLIDVSYTSNVRICTVDGYTVILGDSIDIADKISRMFEALDRFRLTHPDGGLLYVLSSGEVEYSQGAAPTACPSETPMPSSSPDPNASPSPSETSGFDG